MKRFTLLTHQWKSILRTPRTNIGLKIYLGFVFVIFFVQIVSGGFFIGELLQQQNNSPLTELAAYGFYFFFGIFFIRYMFQKPPSLSIKPYLVLPIQPSRLINFILTKPLFHIINIIPIGFAIALIIGLREVLTKTEAILLFLIIILGDLIMNYLGVLVKKFSLKHTCILYGIIGLTALLVALEYFEMISLTKASTLLFSSIIDLPYLLIIPVLILGIIYYLNFSFLYNNFTLENYITINLKDRGASSNESFLKRYGKIGELTRLELKLCMRSKRAKTLMATIPILFAYSFYTFSDLNINEDKIFLMIIALYTIGAFSMTYGIYLFSWESSYFDGLLTSNITYKEYLAAKYLLFNLVTTTLFLISIVYGFFNSYSLVILSAVYLFMIGIINPFIIYMSMYNKKTIDLNKSSFFNYQGSSTIQYVLVFPLFLVPVGLYLPFQFIDRPTIGFLVLGSIGLLGIILRERTLTILETQFKKKHYSLARNFRTSQ